MLKKDKQKVIGEALDEAKVKAFLNYEPYTDDYADYHILTKAYRGLPPHEFARFVTFYKEAGRDLNPINGKGVKFIDSISANTSHMEYIDILKQAGA